MYDKVKEASEIAAIASTHCGVETLDTQNSDSLDFHDISVWSLRDALAEAYAAGRAST